MKKAKRQNLLQRFQKQITAFAAIVLVAGLGVLIYSTSSAATISGVTVSLSPASTTATVGSTVTLSVIENSGTSTVDGVNAILSYPSNLTYQSSSLGSTFASPLPGNGGGGGTVTLAGYTLPPFPSGQQTLGTIVFTVTSASSSPVTVSFTGSTQVTVAVSGNTTVGTPTTVGASLTLQNPVTPTCPSGDTGTYPNCVAPTCPSGQTGTPPNCVTPPSGGTTPPSTSGGSPTPTNTVKPSTTSTTPVKSPSSTTAITPQGSSTPIPAANGSEVQISAPATVGPTQSTSSPIIKAEYFLGTKLLATETKSPFSYKLNTRDIRNGTYTFKTITFYEDGTKSVSSQKLVINNPPSITQLRLTVQSYTAPIVVTLLILALVLLFVFRWHDLIWKFKGFRSPIGESSDSNVTVGGLHTPPDGNPLPTNIPPTPPSPPVVLPPSTKVDDQNPGKVITFESDDPNKDKK